MKLVTRRVRSNGNGPQCYRQLLGSDMAIRSELNGGSTGEVKEVEFDSEFSEFLGWVSEAKFDALLSGRPTF